MVIKDDTFPRKTFGEFCDSEHLVVTVRERAGEIGKLRYFATCDAVSTKESDGMLCGAMGNGATREAAALEYARRLAGRRIVVDSMARSRRELQCPNEWEG
jgi:phosphotransacetylase